MRNKKGNLGIYNETEKRKCELIDMHILIVISISTECNGQFSQ